MTTKPDLRTQAAWATMGLEDTAAMDRISSVLRRTDLTPKQRMHLVCCAVGDTDRLVGEDLP